MAGEDGEDIVDADSYDTAKPIPMARAVAGAQTGLPGPSLTTASYNRDAELDKARKIIAYALLAILGGVILLLAFIPLTYLLLVNEANKNQLEPVLQLISIIFGPVVALVGSATGFYFGAQSVQPSK